MESKADATYPVVSAASIVAKVQRDTELEALGKSAAAMAATATPTATAADHHYQPEQPKKSAVVNYSVIGSGYPGDERTKNWLKTQVDPIFGFPELVR